MRIIHCADESRWTYFKIEAHNKLEGVKVWCYNNRYILIRVAITVGTAVLPILIKRGIKARDLRKAKDLKELYCYDRKLGHYWKLRRELTNEEWLIIDKRKANGERLADILAELKVLY